MYKRQDKSCYFTAGAYRYDAELLYQDADWQQSCPCLLYTSIFRAVKKTMLRRLGKTEEADAVR